VKTEPILKGEHLWPQWAPSWLQALVESPDCSSGTHPTMRHIAKWLVIYMPPSECPGLAFYWLRQAANRCDRVPDDSELNRLLSWAVARFSEGGAYEGQAGEGFARGQPVIDIELIYNLVIASPTLPEFRSLSPVRLYDTSTRNTPMILDEWAAYARQLNPWVCYGSRDHFWTRRLSDMRSRASAFEQIVPSPMLAQYGETADGHLSEHSLKGTGPRTFLVTEFDFTPVTRQRKPSIWAPLIKACADKGRNVLDINAALTAHLRSLGNLWMVVFSGGKSLQSWWPCLGTEEDSLLRWYRNEALSIGACPSTKCRSQFVRMPDGSRDDGRRQCIEYYNPAVLEENADLSSAQFSSSY
jgi:hypothetical protein